MALLLHKIFKEWEEIARPILVNLMTAVLLVLGSLVFKPVREFLLPPEGDPNYPIYCVAEPFRDPDAPKKLNIDFFIINLSDVSHTRETLQSRLETLYGAQQQGSSVNSDFVLAFNRKVAGKDLGRVESVLLEEKFNQGKGAIRTEIIGNDVRIMIDSIQARAVMKIMMVITDLPSIEGNDFVLRTDRVLVPFDDERYEAACHSR